MNKKPIDVSIRSEIVGRISDAPVSRRVAEGVPLVKLIRRRLEPVPDLVVLSQRHSDCAERFSLLKTTLSDLPQAPQVLLISSGTPSEGKTVIAANLALAFAADSNEKVLLIDADLRRPTLGKWVTPPPQVGLTHVLAGEATEDHAIVELEGTPLDFLPAGELRRDPVPLISSSRIENLLRSLRVRYTRIVIDTPPLLPFADADMLGKLTDGILLVVRASEAAVAAYSHTLEAVTSTRVLGVVLNDVSGSNLAS